MATTKLRLLEDNSGDLWLCVDPADDTGEASLRPLGRPTEALYHFVPECLWPELADLIRARREAVRYESAYRREIEATYRSQQL